jgi:hypothetical protein
VPELRQNFNILAKGTAMGLQAESAELAEGAASAGAPAAEGAPATVRSEMHPQAEYRHLSGTGRIEVDQIEWTETLPRLAANPPSWGQ